MPGTVVSYLTINPKASALDVLVFTVEEQCHEHVFAATDAYCAKPACDCRLVSLTVNQLRDDDQPDPQPLHLFLHLDTRAITDAQGAPLEGEPGSVLAHFKEQALEEGLPLWKKHYAQAKAYGRDHAWELKDFSELEAGSMLAWVEVHEDEPLWETLDGARSLAVVDRYCPAPDCNCHEVLLSFVVPVSQEITGDEPEAMVRYSLRSGQVQLEEAGPFPDAHAEKLAKRFMKDAKRAKEVKRRYQEIKRIGKLLGERYPHLAAGWGMRLEAGDELTDDSAETPILGDGEFLIKGLKR